MSSTFVFEGRLRPNNKLIVSMFALHFSLIFNFIFEFFSTRWDQKISSALDWRGVIGMAAMLLGLCKIAKVCAPLVIERHTYELIYF